MGSPSNLLHQCLIASVGVGNGGVQLNWGALSLARACCTRLCQVHQQLFCPGHAGCSLTGRRPIWSVLTPGMWSLMYVSHSVMRSMCRFFSRMAQAGFGCWAIISGRPANAYSGAPSIRAVSTFAGTGLGITKLGCDISGRQSRAFSMMDRILLTSRPLSLHMEPPLHCAKAWIRVSCAGS